MRFNDKFKSFNLHDVSRYISDTGQKLETDTKTFREIRDIKEKTIKEVLDAKEDGKVDFEKIRKIMDRYDDFLEKYL